MSARLEAELSELTPEDAGAMREDLGLAESSLQTVVCGAFSLLQPGFLALPVCGAEETAGWAPAPASDLASLGEDRATTPLAHGVRLNEHRRLGEGAGRPATTWLIDQIVDAERDLVNRTSKTFDVPKRPG